MYRENETFHSPCCADKRFAEAYTMSSLVSGEHRDSHSHELCIPHLVTARVYKLYIWTAPLAAVVWIGAHLGFLDTTLSRRSDGKRCPLGQSDPTGICTTTSVAISYPT